MELRATILRNGNGKNIRYLDGSRNVKKLYRTENRELGTDATNPIRIERGLSVPCEAGIYPLEFEEMSIIEKFKGNK